MRQVLNRCKAFSYDFLALESYDFVAPPSAARRARRKNAVACTIVLLLASNQNTAARCARPRA
jgi:hypothetical protein